MTFIRLRHIRGNKTLVVCTSQLKITRAASKFIPKELNLFNTLKISPYEIIIIRILQVAALVSRIASNISAASGQMLSVP